MFTPILAVSTVDIKFWSPRENGSCAHEISFRENNSHVIKSCGATSEGSSVVVRKDHDHPPNPAETTNQLAIDGMKNRA